jgi:hypothetical protein
LWRNELRETTKKLVSKEKRREPRYYTELVVVSGLLELDGAEGAKKNCWECRN